MQMTREVHYRWHRNDIPTLTPDNAYSAPWGVTFAADGTTYTCVTCDGTGHDTTDPACGHCHGDGCAACDHTGHDTACGTCDGQGVIDCERGYSACDSPAELINYFADRLDPGTLDRDGTVVVFEGEYVGDGLDDEPLIVPTRTVATMSWTEFVREYGDDQ
jgi:hypothetical protein